MRRKLFSCTSKNVYAPLKKSIASRSRISCIYVHLVGRLWNNVDGDDEEDTYMMSYNNSTTRSSHNLFVIVITILVFPRHFFLQMVLAHMYFLRTSRRFSFVFKARN